MYVNTEFDRGDIVYVRTDPDQMPYIVVAIIFYMDNSVQYLISHNHMRYYVYAIEISKETDVLDFGEEWKN